jgi:hypothetical protein
MGGWDMISSRVLPWLSACAFVTLFILSQSVRADEMAGAVEGKVTFKGQPVADGKIIFHYGNGQFAGCKIKNGDYKIDHVVAGATKITVEGKGIPAKFMFDDKTPLTADIVAGKQNFDIDLTD